MSRIRVGIERLALDLGITPEELVAEGEKLIAERAAVRGYEWKRDLGVTGDLLGLVGVRVPLEALEGWSDEDLQEAEEWASAEYARASDHVVKVPAVPAHVAKFKRGQS